MGQHIAHVAHCCSLGWPRPAPALIFLNERVMVTSDLKLKSESEIRFFYFTYIFLQGCDPPGVHKTKDQPVLCHGGISSPEAHAHGVYLNVHSKPDHPRRDAAVPPDSVLHTPKIGGAGGIAIGLQECMYVSLGMPRCVQGRSPRFGLARVACRFGSTMCRRSRFASKEAPLRDPIASEAAHALPREGVRSSLRASPHFHRG